MPDRPLLRRLTPPVAISGQVPSAIKRTLRLLMLDNRLSPFRRLYAAALLSYMEGLVEEPPSWMEIRQSSHGTRKQWQTDPDLPPPGSQREKVGAELLELTRIAKETR